MSEVSFVKLKQSDDALRELLLRRIGETTNANQRYEALADGMRTDAQVFAATMRDARAVTDTAVHQRKTREQGMFRYAEYVDDTFPVWFLRTKQKYGGGDLDTSSIRRYESVKRRLAIRYSGALSIVSWYSDHYSAGHISPEPEVLPAEAFITRSAVDTQEGVASAQSQWTHDLEEAAQRYTQHPFTRFDIRKS